MPTRTTARAQHHIKLAPIGTDSTERFAALPVDRGAPQLDRGAMSATFVVSDEAVDRSGDRVLVQGIDLRNHARNPCVLWNHGRNDHDRPIGLSQDPSGRYTTRVDHDRRQLIGTVYFASDPFSTDVFRAVESGLVRGASIGYRPIAAAPMPEAHPDDENPPQLLKALELIEWSLVVVPDNPNCLRVQEVLTKGWNGGRRVHPKLRKALEPYAAPRKPVVRGGFVPENKKPSTGPAPAPLKDTVTAGSRHLHDVHDLLLQLASMMEQAAASQENPDVQAFQNQLGDDLERWLDQLRELHAGQYPDDARPGADLPVPSDQDLAVVIQEDKVKAVRPFSRVFRAVLKSLRRTQPSSGSRSSFTAHALRHSRQEAQRAREAAAKALEVATGYRDLLKAKSN